MALPGKNNPFATGLTEKPPVAGIKKTFTKIPLSTGVPSHVEPDNRTSQETQSDAPRTEVPQIDIPQNKAPQIDVPQIEVCQNDISQFDIPDVLANDKKDEPPLKRAKSSSIELESKTLAAPLPTKESNATKNESHLPQIDIPQNKVPQFDIPQNDIPQIDTTEIQVPQNGMAEKDAQKGDEKKPNEVTAETIDFGIQYGGYFPLRCSFFRPELFLKINEGETKIILYLAFLGWRYGSKFGGARASVSYISKGTGISESSVNRHLKSLITNKYVEPIKTDMRNGNVYRITDTLVYFDYVKEREGHQVPQIDIPQTGVPQNDIEGMPKQQGTSVNLTEDLCQNDTQDLTPSSSSKFSYSQHEPFNSRWESLPKRLREREISVINYWTQKDPADLEHLYAALIDFETTRKDIHGRDCVSPIGLIESSWPTIKAHREKAALEAKRKAEAVNHQNSEAERKAKAEEAEALRYKQACERFDNLTDEEYDQLLARVHESPDYVEVKPLKGSKAASSAIRMHLLAEIS